MEGLFNGNFSILLLLAVYTDASYRCVKLKFSHQGSEFDSWRLLHPLKLEPGKVYWLQSPLGQMPFMDDFWNEF